MIGESPGKKPQAIPFAVNNLDAVLRLGQELRLFSRNDKFDHS
jgi:hypothetical protein